MQLTYKYKLKPTKSQAATISTHLELCRRQYNYRLSERFRWWEATRTPINACSLNTSIVRVEEIYKNIPVTITQIRDGRKKDKAGNPITQKSDEFSNIVCGYVQWQTVQLADLKNTKKLFPEYKSLDSQVLQNVVNRVETSFSNFTTPDKDGNRRGKPRFKGFHYYKSFTYPQIDNLNIIKDEQGRICIYLAKIGQVPMVFHRSIPTGFKVKTGTVIKEVDGWYISLTLEDKMVPVTVTEIQPTEDNSLGIDLGITNYVYLSNGERVENPRFLVEVQGGGSSRWLEYDRVGDMEKTVPELIAAISPSDWALAPQSILELIYELVRRTDKLEAEMAQLRTENELLKEQVARTSANSSQPPSKNPQGFKPNRKESTGKKRGGQLGHIGSQRKLYPEEMCQEVIHHYPQECSGCGAKIEQVGNQPADYRHQIVEIPPVQPIITEHQFHPVTCNCCGKKNHAASMPEIIRGGGYGARVTAYVGLLSSQYRQSYRQIQQLMQAVFGIEMSIGTINRLRIEVSEALGDAVTEAQSYIQHSPTVGVDETGFKQRNGDGQNAAKTSGWLGSIPLFN